MAKNNNIEEQFKDILKDNSIDIDTGLLWDDISDALPQKRKRRPLIWFIFGLGSGILLLGSLLIMDKDNTDAMAEAGTADAVQTIAQESTSTEGKSDAVSFEEKTSSSNTARHTDNKISSSLLTPSFSNSITTTTTRSSARQLANQNTEQQQTFGSRELSLPSSNMALGRTAGSVFGDAPFKENEEASYANADQVDKLSSDMISSESFALTANVSLPLLSDLPKGTLPSALYSNGQNGLREAEFSFVEVKRNPKKWASAFTIAAGPAFTSWRYEHNTDVLADKALENKESIVASYLADLSYRLMHQKGFGLVMGLSYGTQASVYRDQSFSQNTEFFESQTDLIDAEGFISQETVLLERTVNSFNDIQWHRVHTSLDFQLGLDKSIVNFGPMQLGARAMVGYNIFTKNKGYYFDSNQASLIKFAENDDNPYLGNTAWSTKLALNLEFNKNQYSFGLMPYWLHRPGSITQAESPYQLYQNNYGLQVHFTFKPF